MLDNRQATFNQQRQTELLREVRNHRLADELRRETQAREDYVAPRTQLLGPALARIGDVMISLGEQLQRFGDEPTAGGAQVNGTEIGA